MVTIYVVMILILDNSFLWQRFSSQCLLIHTVNLEIFMLCNFHVTNFHVEKFHRNDSLLR